MVKIPPFSDERRCTKVSEFLEQINPKSLPMPADFRAFPRAWLFRGHGDANWDLRPTALRPDVDLIRGIISIRTTLDQIIAEWRLLSDFYEAADEAGLPIPEDSHSLRKLMAVRPDPFFDPPDGRWPKDELLSLMAIGQHHGLPTRLLDWSWNHLKAAYFAASDAADPKFENTSGLLSVWIMSAFTARYSKEFSLITAPAFTNSNLRSQEGVFTCTHIAKAMEVPVDRRTVNEILHAEEEEAQKRGELTFSPHLVHVTLPADKAEELIWELALQGVSRAKLFPDYYAVVKGLKETRQARR